MLIALLGSVVEALLMAALISAIHVKQIYVLMPAQVLLYAFLMGSLAVIFRRYYGRPFWQSLRWMAGGPECRICGGLRCGGGLYGDGGQRVRSALPTSTAP